MHFEGLDFSCVDLSGEVEGSLRRLVLGMSSGMSAARFMWKSNLPSKILAAVDNFTDLMESKMAFCDGVFK